MAQMRVSYAPRDRGHGVLVLEPALDPEIDALADVGEGAGQEEPVDLRLLQRLAQHVLEIDEQVEPRAEAVLRAEVQVVLCHLEATEEGIGVCLLQVRVLVVELRTERPGALLRFLEAVGTHWNITLFHYRNHGSDTGRVVAGIVVPPETREDFLLHLTALHYPWVDETANPAYRLFLAG